MKLQMQQKMSAVTRWSIAGLLLPAVILGGCGHDDPAKEVMIRAIDLADKMPANISVTDSSRKDLVLDCEGSHVRINVLMVQDTAGKYVSKLLFYRYGSNEFKVSEPGITAVYNAGTIARPVMAVSGSVQFNRSSVLRQQLETRTFYIDGSGKMNTK